MMSCFCSSGKAKKKKSLYDELIIEERISEKEREFLTMIFENLANRSSDRKLTQNNFMLFFSLTGLWGDKLFRYFNSGKKNGISLHEFLNGIAKTARGNFDEKVQILFNFIKEPAHKGIRYRQFLKMLYHFSKDELKEIMVNDGVFVHESIIPEKEFLQKMEDSIIYIKNKPRPKLHLEKKTSFQQAYQDIMSQYQDPGTTLHFKTQNLTYKVDYINMISLTKQFSTHVFKKYEINEDIGFIDQSQFNHWIKGNPKLFEKFFGAFRQKIWGIHSKVPLFLRNIQKQCEVDLIETNIKQRLYMMLSENIIFFSVAKNCKESVFRIVCLDGLAISMSKQKYMEFKDIPNGYSKFELLFNQKKEAQQWLLALSHFQKNYVQTKYEVFEPIGTGKFSIVYKALDRKTKRPYALKVIDLTKLGPRGRQSIENQTKIMRNVRCHSIIRHYQTVYCKENVYIATQYVFGEDLFEYVKKNKRLDEFEAAFILGQVIQAVIHLHNLEIIHRDLKPQNIMIQYERQVGNETSDSPSPCRLAKPRAQTVKIIDLGFSNYSSSYDQMQKTTVQGTPNYIAPEILLGQKPSFQNDTFAIGSILYFMLRGNYAFKSSQPQGTAIRTVKGDYCLHDHIWEGISEEAKDLVEMLLETEPSQRIELKSALDHAWFQKLNSNEPKRQDSTDHE